MEQKQIILLLGSGVFLFMLAIYVRVRFGNQFELKPLDLALVILPLLFVALATGKIKGFDAFGVRADFSELFAKAARQNIEQQVRPPSLLEVDEVVDMLQIADKVGVSKIPDLLAKKTQGLVFRLGHGGYFGSAIEQYFDALYASSFLEFIIILEEDGQLFGVFDVMDLAVIFRANGAESYENLASWLNQPNDQAKQSLASWPGFVGLDNAVRLQTSKLEVLQKMDELPVSRLPVVNESNQFVGSLERSKLMASLLLELAQKVD